MIDHASVSAWLEDYVRAWKSNDAEAIGGLFSEDAHYYYGPFEQPLIGRAAIVASWQEDPDTPGTFDAHYEPLTVEGSSAVANGRSLYLAPGSKVVGAEYDNIFLLRFDADGRCAEFREWFVKRP